MSADTNWCVCKRHFEDECHGGRLLWLLSVDSHIGVTPALVQLGVTRKSAPALSRHARWKTEPRVLRPQRVKEPKKILCRLHFCP
ncbi:hypothetical protein AVEN_170229-1 [Araneus ventricosus]|uniref:Uncharacterized protein n=1 Tax=Araneus ventricosus TaxID=182803 RepID=A0A4Y2KCE5_ARAVE|nr:hypothetical protein AVEN_170229-1 [Araneus ventricosus]